MANTIIAALPSEVAEIHQLVIEANALIRDAFSLMQGHEVEFGLEEDLIITTALTPKLGSDLIDEDKLEKFVDKVNKANRILFNISDRGLPVVFKFKYQPNLYQIPQLSFTVQL